jgi:hypothetical protein
MRPGARAWHPRGEGGEAWLTHVHLRRSHCVWVPDFTPGTGNGTTIGGSAARISTGADAVRSATSSTSTL